MPEGAGAGALEDGAGGVVVAEDEVDDEVDDEDSSLPLSLEPQAAVKLKAMAAAATPATTG